MCIAVHVTGNEDETTAQLKGVLPELVLPETSALGAFS
jgi:hypothetical protein